MIFEEMESALRARLEALPPAARVELLHVLRLPDFDRTDRIGEFWVSPQTRTFAELLIECRGWDAASSADRDAARGLTPPLCVAGVSDQIR
jgi:hypothetical protein